MSGRIGKAPCGHDGEAIVGQFYLCSQGCDSKKDVAPVKKPRFIVNSESGVANPPPGGTWVTFALTPTGWAPAAAPATTQLCPKCCSDDTEPDALTLPNGKMLTMHCKPCGAAW